MSLDRTTFEYLKPTDEQINQMAGMRAATAEFASLVERNVPAGPDRTYIIRKIREVGMWINVAITRDENGVPRI